MRRLSYGLQKLTTRRHCVAGLDVSAERVQLVVLGGDAHSPHAVYGADQQPIPRGWVVDGVVQSPAALAQWLKQYMQAHDYAVDHWYIGLADAQVRYHMVSLPKGLPPEDVAFQLQHETRQVFASEAQHFALDYELDLDSMQATSTVCRYLVGACPQACVDSWLQVAHAGGFHFAALEPRQDAVTRVNQTTLTGRMPAASVALALQCDAAFGLALAGWSKGGYNFLPHRPLWLKALHRAGWVGMAVCAMGGAMLAAGFALVATASADATQLRLQQGVPAEQLLAKARQGYQQAQAAQKLQVQRAQWLHGRQTQQAQSLAWSQALSQASQGVWVSHIQQQGEHWRVEGEALSSSHAQRLLSSLKALDIWAKPPELPQLQLGTSAVAGTSLHRGAGVWLFRIEAELKAGS